MEYETLKENFTHVLYNFEVEWNYPGVDRNLKTYLENKGPLIEKLRRHPRWNEDAQAIILTAHDSRDSNPYETRGASTLLLEWAIKNAKDETHRKIIEKFYSERLVYFTCEQNMMVSSSVLSKEDADVLNEKYKSLDLRLNGGQKSSRAINKFLKLCCNNTEGKEYIALFSDWANKINPLHVERPFIISVNPGDYITMSYGNSWASCHIANPEMARGGETYSGCYRAGTLSYMSDKCTVICYTVEELPEEIENLPLTPKLTRQCFMLDFETGAFVQSWQYPETNNEERAKEYRNLVQAVMAEIMGQPNYLTLSSGKGHFMDAGGYQYPDYDYAEKNHIKYCTLKSLPGARKEKRLIGYDPFCLQCGDSIENEGTL